MMWPDHCIQGSDDAKFVIEPKEGEFIQQKGTRLLYDSYSAFMDDGEQDTGLAAHLKSKGITTVIGFGLATDYCVNFSVTDAAKMGFKTYWLPDLCRGIDP